MIRITELRVPVDASDRDVADRIAHRLGLARGGVREWRAWRRSVDARNRSRPVFVMTVDAEVAGQEAVLAKLGTDRNVQATPETRWDPPRHGTEPMAAPPVVVGTGPAGLFAALVLATEGYRPVVLERGDPVDERVRAVQRHWEGGLPDPESNVQFGEGGAGTFSDGKLTTRIHDPRARRVMELLVECGAPREILETWQPHVGTDRLRGVVGALRRRIEALGGTVRFRTRLDDLETANGRVVAAVLPGGERIPAGAVVLAPGHSARDTFAMLHARGIPLERKPFAIGLRIEHPQALVDRAQYGALAGHPRLGPATYRLVWHSPEGRAVYTFCMCPGGVVVASASEAGGVVTNGMSEHARDGFNANAGVVVAVGADDFPGDGPLAGVAWQREWERAAFRAGGGDGWAPAQRVEDFLAARATTALGQVCPTYRPGVRTADLSGCLPDFVARAIRGALPAMDRQLRGFALPDALLTGVETRTSSPVRLPRDEACESPVGGLYPCGEGAGHAGGIVSAAVDGIRVAESIVGKWAAPVSPL